MAFRGTEIMVIVRGQNYASQMLRRVSGDLGGVSSAAASANARLAATQAKIVSAVGQQAKIQKAVNEGPARIAANRAVVDAKAQQASLALQQRRNTLQRREQTLVDGVGKKHGDILKTQQDLNKINDGSIAKKNAQDLSKLEEKKLSLKASQNELDQRASVLQKNLLTQQASQLRLIERARKEDIGFRSNIGQEQLARYSAGAGSKAQQIMAKELLANRIALANTQEKIATLPSTQINEQIALNQQAATLAAEEERISALIGEQGVQVERLTRQLVAQQGQLTRIGERLVGIKEEYAAIGAQENLNNAQNAKAILGLEAEEAQLEKLKLQLLEINAVIEKQLPAELAVNAALAEQAKLADRVNRVKNVGSLTSHVGRVAQFGGLIGTAALGATALNYAHFTSETTQAATQMANIASKGFGDVTVKAKTLQKVILDMMKQFPANAKEQADAAYNLFSSIPALNGPGGEAKGFALLTAANRAAVAGNTDLATSTSALIKVMNNFGDEGQSVNQIMNRMFAIVRFGNMHFADFDSMLNQIAPAAKGAGQTLNDLAGVIAESTIHMAPAQAATGIARLLQIFQRKEFVKGATNLGVNILKPGGNQLLPIMDILDNFIKKYPALQKGGLALANLFKEVTSAAGKGVGTQGTIQAQKLLNILITNYPELQKLQKETTSDNAEFARSYAAMSQTAGVKWSIFMNLIRASVIMIGQTVLPVFAKIGGHIKDMIDWFDKLSPHTRSVIGEFAAWAAIGLLLGGTLLHIGGVIISLAAPVLKLTKLFEGLTIAEGLMEGVLLLLPVIAAVITYEVMTHLGKIEMFWNAITRALPTLWANGWKIIDGLTIIAVAEIAKAFLWLAERASKFLSWIPGLSGLFGDAFNGANAAIDNFEQTGVAKLGQAGSDFKKAFNDGWNSLPMFYTTEGLGPVGKQQPAWTPPGLSGVTTGKTTKKSAMTDMQKWMKLLSDPAAFAKYVSGTNDAANAQADLNALLNQGTNNITTLANTAAQKADAIAAAGDKMKQKIQSVVQNLMTLFNNFQQVNEQTFGPLFGGREMQGPLGQVYSQLAQYNIAPPISLLTSDLRTQDKDFEAYRRNLKKIKGKLGGGKGAVPQGLIDELQAAGPSGRLAIQTLANSTKAQIETYIKLWKQKKGDIQNATTVDYNNKLKEYESYGKKTMWAILTGMKSQTLWLSKGFTKYVLTDTLGAAMTKWINSQFPNLIKSAEAAAGKAFDTKKAREAAAKASVAGKKAPTTPVTKLPGGGKTTTVKPLTLSDHQKALIAQAKLLLAGYKAAFTITKASGDTNAAKKAFQKVLEERAELKRLQQGKTAIPKGEHWSVKLGKFIKDALPKDGWHLDKKTGLMVLNAAKKKIPAKTAKAASGPVGSPGPKGGTPPAKKGLSGPAGRGQVVTHSHVHHEKTELHIHGQVGESLQAAGRRLLFEHQVGVRRRRAMQPGHP